MPMREAITASNVPIYQELARRIGLERYHQWLDRLDYGNRQTGTALEAFWLDGPLEISAIEQARFVARLALNQLPISDRSQTIVRDILKLESKEGRTLFGKTGWRFSSVPQLGWWTGWVDSGGKITTFSLNIDMQSPQDAPKRVAIEVDACDAWNILASPCKRPSAPSKANENRNERAGDCALDELLERISRLTNPWGHQDTLLIRDMCKK